MASIPSRPADALPASQFMQSLGSKDSGNRDSLIAQEVLRGNVPNFMRKFVPVTITDNGNTLIYYVAPDYLCLGNDQDYIRVPLGGQAAQSIVSAFDCILPTSKMSNQIWKAASAKIAPKPMSGINSNINGKNYTAKEFIKNKLTDTDSFIEHNRLIQEQLSGRKPGELVAGNKKDIVLSNELATHPDRVAIHGLHDTNGKAIQGESWVHDINYRDYSHGIRLVDKTALLNGKQVSLASIMQDPKYSSLVSDEGPMKLVAYNAGKTNVSPAQKPKTQDLLQKIDEYLDQITKLV